MNKKSILRWISLVSISLFFFLGVFKLLTWIVDPFFQYRVRDNRYMINVSYCAPGLIKNYDYDTIMIGSSMTQNFDMSVFRSELDCSPLHIGIGGMSDEEMVEYIQLANRVGKAKTYYLGLDIATFRNESESKTIQYLMKDDLISDLQYTISYESLFRFLPIDVVFSTFIKLGKTLPESYQYRMQVDRIGYWGHEFKYGTDIVWNGRKTGDYAVSKVDTTDLYNRLIDGIDNFFSKLDLRNSKYIFFFTPYSSLFWCDAQDAGYFEDYLNAEEYFIKKATEKGAIVYDFQGDELTMDLDNYKDTTHYSPQINNWMTKCFDEGKNIVTPENYLQFRQKIIDNTERFRQENMDFFKSDHITTRYL